jgi:hypothetical protein
MSDHPSLLIELWRPIEAMGAESRCARGDGTLFPGIRGDVIPLEAWRYG